MSKVRSGIGMVSVVVLALGAGAASGQDFPNRPIRIVNGAVGGNTDAVIRLIAPELSSKLGQPMIVDNRGGIIQIHGWRQHSGYFLQRHWTRTQRPARRPGAADVRYLERSDTACEVG